MTRLAAALALAVLSAASMAHAGGAAAKAAKAAKPTPPSKLFLALARSVSDAGFHLDDRYPDGWKAPDSSVCHFDSRPRACALLQGEWQSVVVADEKPDGDAVVQELWAFDFASVDDAKAAVTSFSGEFDYGPFMKHPYHVFRCGAEVFAIEGRFRWHTARKQLRAHVDAWLVDHCVNDAPKL